MRFLEGFQRRRKDTRFILRMLGVLLVCLTVVFYLLQKSRDLPSLLVANRVLLFVLFYINVVLILAVLFVLARSIFKLLLERRARILGAKFRSKLVATYVGLSLVPVLVMFVYANVLLQQSVDRWFAAPVESVLRQGSAVAENLLRLTEQRTLHDARVIAEELSGLELDLPRQRARLDRRLQPALLREDLDFLGVYREADFVTAVVDPDAGLGDLPEPHDLMLREAAMGGESAQPIPPPRGEGQLVLAAVPIPGSVPPGGVLVAGRLLPPAVANQTSLLIAAYQQYRQLETQKPELRTSQVLVFLMVTLLVLLASTWVGLYLARQVTAPIEALAEGTRRISGGDLSHRVEVPADDELAVLVGSFNEMTAELQRSRLLLEEGNRELQAANRRLDEERGLLGGGAAERRRRRHRRRPRGARLPLQRRGARDAAPGRGGGARASDPRGVGGRRAEASCCRCSAAATAAKAAASRATPAPGKCGWCSAASGRPSRSSAPRCASPTARHSVRSSSSRTSPS